MDTSANALKPPHREHGHGRHHAAHHTKVYFHVECRGIRFGETVRVVGDHPSLGNWDPEKGLELETQQDLFPVFISQHPVFIDLHAKVEYKYLLCGVNGQPKEWEGSEIQHRFVANGTEMTLEDDEGAFRTKVAVGLDEADGEQEGMLRTLSKSRNVQSMDKEQRLSFIKDLEGKAEIGANDTVFMLAFQLPMKVIKDSKDGQWKLSQKAPTDGRNFAFLPLIQEIKEKKKFKVVNIGWPGVHPETEKDKREIEKLLAANDMIPVWPPRKEFEDFLVFCRDLLWPVFHDSMQTFQSVKTQLFNEQGWAAYQHINNIYATSSVPHLHESDLIWVQDYHMLMTPTFIARKIHKANIGFYLHVPFPSSDSFKSLPVREEILAGMLSADQLGFQFFSYARNFIVSCKRIYGLEPAFRTGGFMGLDWNGRNIMIKVSHFAYPYQASIKVVESEEVQREAVKVKELFPDKIIFAGMDRADGLSGMIPKFQAFKQFLKEKPEYTGKCVLVQYCFEAVGGKEDLVVMARLRKEDMFEAVNLIDPTEEEDESLRSTTDDSSENDECGMARLKAKSEVLLPKRQSSGKLSVGGGLCGLSPGLSGDLRGSLGGGLASLGEFAEEHAGRRFFTCTVGRKPSAAKFFLDDTDEVSELLASLKQVQEKQNKESNLGTWSYGDGRDRGSALGLPSFTSGSSP